MDETLILNGGSIKSLGDGRFEGPLVVFSDGTKRDTDGNWFDAKTDFGFEGRESIETAIYYHHGLDSAVKKTRIGTGTLTLKKDSVWLEGQLKKRRQYVSEIEQLIAKGALGLSSGSAPHLIEPETWTKGGRIAMWPLGLDASLTPTPADPRTYSTAVKSSAVVVESFEDLCKNHAIKADAAPEDDLDLSDDVEDPTKPHKGLLVALFPPADIAARLAIESGEPPEALHVTLAYCGDADTLGGLAVASAVVSIGEVARQVPALAGMFNGIGRFSGSATSDWKDVLYAAVDVPGLAGLRERVAQYLDYAGCPPRADHGWTPHMTLAYLEATADSPLARLEPVSVAFGAITVIAGDMRIDIPLGRGAAALDYAKALKGTWLKGELDDAIVEQEARRSYWDLQSAFDDKVREIGQEIEDGEETDGRGRVEALVSEYGAKLLEYALMMVGVAKADAAAKSSERVVPLAGTSLDAQTTGALAAVRGLTERWSGLATKVGAAMSRSRRGRVAATRDSLREHADTLDAILKECEPKTIAKSTDIPSLEWLKFRASLKRPAA